MNAMETNSHDTDTVSLLVDESVAVPVGGSAGMFPAGITWNHSLTYGCGLIAASSSVSMRMSVLFAHGVLSAKSILSPSLLCRAYRREGTNPEGMSVLVEQLDLALHTTKRNRKASFGCVTRLSGVSVTDQVTCEEHEST